MGEPLVNRYNPNYVSAPGETLLEAIEALGMSQAQLAERTGKSKKNVNEIIKGKAPITPETALQLERAIGMPARFWNNRERYYREWLAREAEQERLSQQVEWLKKFPVKDMIKKGWIEQRGGKVEQLRELLNFFGVVEPGQVEQLKVIGQVAFRKARTYAWDEYALAAWLRRGELLAQDVACKRYDKAAFRAALQEIRGLTRDAPEDARPQLVQACAEAGVAVVFVPELPKTRVSGATRWLTPTKALVQLSFRYKLDDQIWFSFFHEAAHILLHGKRQVFVDAADDDSDQPGDKEEEEANQFATDHLIPPAEFVDFLASWRHSNAEIERFAYRVGIAPGIVVGRLQREGRLPFTHGNRLKRRFLCAN